MTGRSLQTRLALFYAAGFFAAGVAVLLAVTVPLAGLESTVPVDSGTAPVITGNGGIGPRRLLLGSAVALAVLVPVALTAGWLVAGRFLRPLRAITATATAISAGSLDRRLGLGEPSDELTALGAVLDDLLARLEAAFDAQRHFVANASHELRTPLAGLRTLLEVTLADPDADAETLRAACREAIVLGEHQERLIQALLTLATSERGLTRHDPLDLAHVVRRVLATRSEEAAARGVTLSDHLTPAVTTGDPGMVESLVTNLIDNAIRHNHPQGNMRISTRTDGPQATLTITNSGPVVPESQLPRLFQPFQRSASGRHHDGYGLGLAIVRAVAHAHHAPITVSAPADGGLTVTVGFAAGHSLPPARGYDETPRS